MARFGYPKERLPGDVARLQYQGRGRSLDRQANSEAVARWIELTRFNLLQVHVPQVEQIAPSGRINWRSAGGDRRL
jgi:hypothetical protein